MRLQLHSSTLYTWTCSRCEERVDPCQTGPCRNGGTCQSRRGQVQCLCPPGWQGRLCERSRDHCEEHACQHAGVCRHTALGQSCHCVGGWRGEYCQDPPSLPSPTTALASTSHCTLCQHGGLCSLSSTGPPSCSCPPGYSGNYCEEAPSVEVVAYQAASPCLASPCHHGACLASSGEAEAFTCQCHPGYSGKLCEYLTTVQLAGAGPYLQLDPLYTSRPLNLTLVVKTTESEGVLLYHGHSDHLAVELFHGRVRVSLHVGNPPASTMFSYSLLNDDRPHAVELLLAGKKLTLRVDGGLARSLVNQGAREELSVGSPTYLGGVPARVGEAALAQWHLRNSTSLRGCITNFFMDDKMIDFLQAAHARPGVLAGCHKRYLSSSLVLHDSQLVVEPQERGRGERRGRRRRQGCEENRCREPGTRACSPREGGHYRCRCKRGYAGRYCEKG